MSNWRVVLLDEKLQPFDLMFDDAELLLGELNSLIDLNDLCLHGEHDQTNSVCSPFNSKDTKETSDRICLIV